VWTNPPRSPTTSSSVASRTNFLTAMRADPYRLPGSARSHILEAEWSGATLAVVGRVWRSEGASLYWRPGTEALRDDLQDWLICEAMAFVPATCHPTTLSRTNCRNGKRFGDCTEIAFAHAMPRAPD